MWRRSRFLGTHGGFLGPIPTRGPAERDSCTIARIYLFLALNHPQGIATWGRFATGQAGK
jgi:hypothetical protein